MSIEISVIIRSMSRPWLREAIASAVNQNVAGLEIVVVDAVGNGHMPLPLFDTTATVRLVSKEQPLSRAEAANFGMAMSQGKFLIFLDDDDLFLDGHLATLNQALNTHPEAVASHTGVRIIDAKLQEIDVYNQPYEPTEALSHNILPIHAVLFRREAAEGCRFDETLEVYEDWDFWLQLNQKGSFVHIDGVTAVYRAHLGTSGLSIAADENLQQQGRARIYEKWGGIWTGAEWNACIDRLLAERNDLKHERNKLEVHISHATSTLVDVRNQLDDTNSRLLQAETDRTLLERAVGDLEADKADLKNNCIQFERERLEFEIETTQLQGERIRLKYRLFDSENETARLKSQLKRLKRTYLELEAEKNRLRNERDLLEQYRDHYQHAFQTIVHSSSWRITGPLRHFATGLKALRQPKTLSWKVASVLFHKLPVADMLKRRAQDHLYQSFPALFKHLPSYQYRVNGIDQSVTETRPLSEQPPFPVVLFEQILAASSPYHSEVPSDLAVDVIIPIYDGIETTRRRLERVINATVKTHHRIILIDDASPREEIRTILDAIPQNERIIVSRNRTNRGFTETVNRGMKLSKKNDVVLLNSDTEVPDGWLDRLVNHAYRSAEIGTVTPFSNNATICSYPHLPGCGTLPEGETLESLDQAAQSANDGRQTDIPTAVGFCMYIKRRCLDAIGLFDVKTFGRGYGEENDFCLRASRQGWRHVLAADLFVFHAGEVSFGDDSDPRKSRALSILQKRYPNYLAKVADYVERDPALAWRLAMTATRFRNGSTPVILMISHGLGGGTEKHIQDLSETLLNSGAKILVARSVPGNSRLIILELNDPVEGFAVCIPIDNEVSLANVLDGFGVSQVHVHHTMHWRIDIQALLARLGRPFVTTVHDYYWICPRVNLMGPTHAYYCGEPGTTACLDCLKQTPRAETTDIIHWRIKHAWLFEDAATVVYPSNDARQRCQKYHPDTRSVVVPHEKSPPVLPPMEKGMAKHTRLIIAILGVVARHKGLEHLFKLAQLASKRGSPVNFIIIGYCAEPIPERLRGFVTQTGSYLDKDLPRLIRETRPDLVWFPACWPETYSYTLTVALTTGVPVLAPRLGAFPERIHERPFAWLYDIPSCPEDLLDWLEEFRNMRISGTYPKSGITIDSPEVSADGYTEAVFWYTSEYLHIAKQDNLRHPFDLRDKGRPSILVVPELLEHNPSPCGYIRLLLPFSTRSRDVVVRFTSPAAALHYRSDIIITQRLAFLGTEMIDTLLNTLHSHGTYLVYDLDDDLLALDSCHQEADIYGSSKAIVMSFLSSANETWVSTQVLKERLTGLTSLMRVISNKLNVDLWHPIEEDTPRGLNVRILYMGTRTHRDDWAKVEPALARLYRLHGKAISIHVIGIDEPGRLPHWVNIHEPPAGIAAVYPAFVHWLKSLGAFDIGIAPLIPSQFNLAKSGIKFMDYTALGAVTVASDLPPYQDVIRHERNGILVAGNTPEDWEHALASIISDPEKRQRLWLQSKQDWMQFHSFGDEEHNFAQLLAFMDTKSSKPQTQRPHNLLHDRLHNG